MTATVPCTRVRKANVIDTLRLLGGVVLPAHAKGAIAGRPLAVAVARKLAPDMRAIRRLQHLRDKYGCGILVLRTPFRRDAIALDPDDVRRVLDGTPAPYPLGENEEASALSHLGLVAERGDRMDCRPIDALFLSANAIGQPLARALLQKVRDELQPLLPLGGREVGWTDFSSAMQKIIRRIVLGDAAADDRALGWMLERLWSNAGGTVFQKQDQKLLAELRASLSQVLERADSNSLAGMIARTSETARARSLDQVIYWLSAWSAAGIAIFRSLALLATHPAHLARVQMEAAAPDDAAGADRFARAVFMEALRLWPITPVVLCETARDTEWGAGVLPAHTRVLIFLPFFYRDDDRLPFANRFTPELWLQPAKRMRLPLVPISGAPGTGPAHALVSFLAAAILGEIVRERRLELYPHDLLDMRLPLPGALDHASLRIRILQSRP